MDLVGIAIIVVGLAATAWLAGVEAVVLRLDPLRALALGVDRDARVRWLVERRSTVLNAVLLATVSVRVTIAIAAVLVAQAHLVAPWAALAAGGVVVVVSLVLGEGVPRVRALRDPVAHASRRLAGIRRLVTVLGPLATLVVRLTRRLAPGANVGPYPEDEPLDEDGPDDQLADEERAMIRSIVALGDTRAREIMVPRPDMVMVRADARLDEVIGLFVAHGTSRIPVFRGDDREDVVGIVYAKDVLARLADGRRAWIDLLRPAAFVPESKHVDDLFEELQAASVHICLVVDEYGAVIGLVTIEDILEEIVGEITDEHDDEQPLVEPVGERTWLVDARLAVDDLAELLDTALPTDDFDTVGGLVIATLGRVPEPGEVVEVAGIVVCVEVVTGRRVARVRVDAPEHVPAVDADEVPA